MLELQTTALANEIARILGQLQVSLLGESPAFIRLLDQVARFAGSEARLLVHGETGTGKELIARAIHEASPRRDGPFVPVNCGAIPDSIIGSELFGQSPQVVPGERRSKCGLVAQANGGTLFLDELESLSPRAQVALLRFLQDHEYRPLGAPEACTTDVRVISATSADLDAMAERGEFRSDLLYRLNGIAVVLPPLRQRGEDVVLLAEAFLQRTSERYGVSAKVLHADAPSTLKAYHWPGNVRELENFILREFLMTDEHELRCESLLEKCVDRTAHSATDESFDESFIEPDASTEVSETSGKLTALTFRVAKARMIEKFERAYVSELLARAGGNVSLAARLAGKERSRLGRLVRKYRLSANEFRAAAKQEETNRARC